MSSFISGFLFSILAGVLGLIIRWAMKKYNISFCLPILRVNARTGEEALAQFQFVSSQLLGIFVIIIFAILMISKTIEPNAILPVFAFLVAVILARN